MKLKRSFSLATLLALITLTAIGVYLASERHRNPAFRHITLGKLASGLHADHPILLAAINTSIPAQVQEIKILESNQEFMAFAKEYNIELLKYEYVYPFQGNTPRSNGDKIAMEMNRIIHDMNPEFPLDSFYQHSIILTVPGDDDWHFPGDIANYTMELITTGRIPQRVWPGPVGGSGLGK